LPRGIALREVRPDDGQALGRFHEALCRDGTQLRSAVVQQRLGAEELVRLAAVVDPDHDMLVAVRGRDVVAVGWCHRIPTTNIAEMAVVVAHPWQDTGIEAVLLPRLVVRARRRSFARLEVLVRPEHERLLEMFQRSGHPVRRRIEDGLVRVSVPLAARGAGGSDPAAGDVMRWHRTSVRYITRYRSTDARYTIESVGGSNARWHLRRQRGAGSDVVGVFASARDASAAAEADAASSRARHPDEPATGPTTTSAHGLMRRPTGSSSPGSGTVSS
jgi:hypothetical protein